MARGIGSLVKSAVGSVAQVPGAEEIVLQAVRDIFNELKQLRRENARLTKEIDRLHQRLDGGRGRTAGSTRAIAPRAKPAARKAAAKRAPKRRGGLLGDLLG